MQVAEGEDQQRHKLEQGAATKCSLATACSLWSCACVLPAFRFSVLLLLPMLALAVQNPWRIAISDSLPHPRGDVPMGGINNLYGATRFTTA